MYKQVILAVSAATLTMSSGALAQSHNSSHNPAIKDPTPHTEGMAAQGRNSFTESQARGRIAKAGYSHVGRLSKDNRGVWQGMAMKGRAKVHVALDYKGIVSTH